jgi:hypothetical protein
MTVPPQQSPPPSSESIPNKWCQNPPRCRNRSVPEAPNQRLSLSWVSPFESKSRLRKSARDDKWSFCLTAGTLCPTNQERQ